MLSTSYTISFAAIIFSVASVWFPPAVRIAFGLFCLALLVQLVNGSRLFSIISFGEEKVKEKFLIECKQVYQKLYEYAGPMSSKKQIEKEWEERKKEHWSKYLSADKISSLEEPFISEAANLEYNTTW